MYHHIEKIYIKLTRLNETKKRAHDSQLIINYCTVLSKIYNKRDDFNFEIVKFPFLDGDVVRAP